MIKQLSHLCLGVRDLQRSLDLYCRLLGFKVIHEFRNSAGECYGVFLSTGGSTFVELFRQQEPMPENSGFFRHLCFEVTDIHAHADYLRRNGFSTQVSRGKTDRVLQCWIDDPDGNRIEFQQFDLECMQYRYLNPGMPDN